MFHVEIVHLYFLEAFDECQKAGCLDEKDD